MRTTKPTEARNKRRPRWGWLALAGMMCLALGAAGWWVLARPAFAPKGEIAFQCRGVARTPRSIAYTQICVINADGSGQRRLTDFDFDVG